MSSRPRPSQPVVPPLSGRGRSLSACESFNYSYSTTILPSFESLFYYLLLTYCTYLVADLTDWLSHCCLLFVSVL
ncbi:hypothetical protein BO79DRAFT_2423 [Aspergillus costaricaensis CBS 115574]|uniref:Uncharacterized protein n=1 Tax=Aspergillus costaricaensis CBS 115574 TaxID=1448317 RepID=A0ACD1IUL4_9EURO|nr:hypothetical protein BO79DRAFT_2423 [Aspergillus costaricaensis CBS 115574]RAK94314.1 hypothetical protein BO79DRAFT_2423 [Aspergillus costaricaensis CBS 115574]